VIRLIGVLAAAVIASGCVSIPRPLEGNFPDFYPDQVTERSVGARVRWGGVILETEPDSDRTCLEILARNLDRSYRPVVSDHSRGRFLACRDGFQDPAIFRRGREVTIIGYLDEIMPGRIGEYEYRYPVLDAETTYLWPERVDTVYVHHHPGYWGWYDPWWGPYPYRSHSRVRGSIHISR